MSCASVDPKIEAWAQRHSLTLFTSFADHECRSAYVSRKAGDCFQFWIDKPANGRICVHAAGVDGQWTDDPAKDWELPISELDAALEDAFATVVGWMVPSERHFPNPRSRSRKAAEWIKRVLIKTSRASESRGRQ